MRSADLSTRHGCRPARQRGHSIRTSTAQGGEGRELLKVGGHQVFGGVAAARLPTTQRLTQPHVSGSTNQIYGNKNREREDVRLGGRPGRSTERTGGRDW